MLCWRKKSIYLYVIALRDAFIQKKKNRYWLKLNGFNQVLERTRYSSEAWTHHSITDIRYIFTPSVFIKVSAFAHTGSGPLEKRLNNVIGLSTRADICYSSSLVSACLELDSFKRVSAQVRGWKGRVMCSFRSASILIRPNRILLLTYNTP